MPGLSLAHRTESASFYCRALFRFGRPFCSFFFFDFGPKVPSVLPSRPRVVLDVFFRLETGDFCRRRRRRSPPRQRLERKKKQTKSTTEARQKNKRETRNPRGRRRRRRRCRVSPLIWRTTRIDWTRLICFYWTRRLLVPST